MEITTRFTNVLTEETIPADIRLYTVKEVAAILKTNDKYVRRLIKCNVLPAIKLGATKIRHDALVRFLENGEGFDYSEPETVRRLVFVA